MRAIRKAGLAGGIVALAAVAAGSALAGYSSGETYSRASQSYQLGYVAGVADALGALQSGKLLKEGAFNDEVAKIVQCLEAKKVKQSQVRGAYLTYLQANPAKKSETAAVDVVNALDIACNR